MALTNVPLTRRMQRMYDAIPVEWQNMNANPNTPLLVKLERRGLIEIRLDPSISKEEASVRTRMGGFGHWQVRRTS